MSRAFWPQLWQDHLFETAIALSLFLHAFFFGSAAFWGRWKVSNIPVMEVDLTMPLTPRSPWDFRAPGAARGMPAPAPKPHPGPAAAPQQAKPTDWIMPSPETQKLEKQVEPQSDVHPAPGAAPGGTGTGGEAGQGGSGGGNGTGEAIGNRPPRLLNMEEIRDALRKAYPEAERAAGHEGQVTVSIMITEDGKVNGVEILDSAGLAFDEAAKIVAQKMLFEPALIRSVPTAVKVRQVVVFKLTN